METKERYEYRPGRFLEKGDLFSVSAGPYFQCESGRKVNMAVKGRLRFDKLIIEDNGNHILYADTCLGSKQVLVVHKSETSPKTDGFVYRPYVIRKVRK